MPLSPRAIGTATLGCVAFVFGCRSSGPDLNARALEACEAGDSVRLEALLREGADPNAVSADSNRGFSILTVSLEHPACLEALLKSGASPVRLDANGLSTLHYASTAPTSLKRLLAIPNIDLEVRGESGVTPLMTAARSEPATLRLLLEAGADVKAVDDRGWTVLHHFVLAALESKDAESALRLLLKSGADPDVVSKDGQTAAQLARSRKSSSSQRLADILDRRPERL